MSLREEIPQLNLPLSADASIKEKVHWAIDVGLADSDDSMREFAAQLLDESNEMLSDEDIATLEHRMETDSDEIVQYRIAYALYCCGHKTQEVEEKLSNGLDCKNEAIRNLIASVFHPAK